MKQLQTYETHIKLEPVRAIGTVSAILAGITVIIGLIRVHSLHQSRLITLGGSIFVIGVLMAISVIRPYSTKLQDRIIRLEETVRREKSHGKQRDPTLTLKQIIALRFASDEELPELASKATKENLSPKDIKIAIKKRKPDTLRV